MWKVLFISISLIIGCCSERSETDLLVCSDSIIKKHYQAIKEKDIFSLNEMYGEEINWMGAFEEELEYEILYIKQGDDGAYARVLENRSGREVHMNFYVINDNHSCKIKNFNADEPNPLDASELENTIEKLTDYYDL